MQLEYTFNINNNNGFISLGVLEKTSVIDEEGNIISSSNHRYIINPLDSNPTESQEIQDKMDEVFTEEIKAEYQKYLDSLKPSYTEVRMSEYTTKLAKLNREYDSAIADISRGVPDTERSTWTKQEQEAKDLLNGSTSTPMLSALAKARGIPVEYLANKVIEKANVYAMIVGELTGTRQRQEDTLKEEYKDIL